MLLLEGVAALPLVVGLGVRHRHPACGLLLRDIQIGFGISAAILHHVGAFLVLCPFLAGLVNHQLVKTEVGDLEAVLILDSLQDAVHLQLLLDGGANLARAAVDLFDGKLHQLQYLADDGTRGFIDLLAHHFLDVVAAHLVMA